MLPDDVIVMVSDVDEIPDAGKVSLLKHCRLPRGAVPVRMELQYFSYYSFRWWLNDTWTGGPIAAPLALVLSGEYTANAHRHKRATAPVWAVGGWHASYFMSPAGIVDK